MSRTRVVVTGLGTTNPLGGDVASTWEALVDGRSGVRHIEADWAEEMPVKIAGIAAVEPTEVLQRVKARRLDRTAQFAMVATLEAWADSGLAEVQDELDADRLGVAMASGIGGVITLLDHYDALKEKGPAPRLTARRADADAQRARRRTSASYVGARAAVQHPGLGLRVRQRGDLAGGRPDPARPRRHRRRRRHGGGDPPAQIAAFANMMALSKNAGDPTTASRPWDTARDGFVLGEGAGVLILESEEHAKARGAKIYAEVLGAGISADSHDIAQPDPLGRGGSRAIQRALAESEIGPESVFHVNAHATSTPQGDIAEGLMLHATLGSHVDQVVVTSTKSMTGHLLGGAGALEAVATILALQNRVVPPTINLDDQDPEVDLDIATKARDLPVGDIAALNNSFGFGGPNVAVAFGSV